VENAIVDGMTREELLAILANDYNEDFEQAHAEHDAALLAYINDPEVAAAFNAQTKWYA
jgi:hypothetical protein